MTPAILACDWGSTHLRAWTLDSSGREVARQDFDLGVNRLAPGEAGEKFLREVRPALGAESLPALLCGAIGSNIGWTTAAYVDCPADLPTIAAGLISPSKDVWIAPGLRCTGLGPAGDVLRGEETQAFGWMAGDPKRSVGRHVICQPGTHAKWSIIENGKIVRFLSAFTGELFAVLSAHSILRNDGRVHEEGVFREGLEAAAEGDGLLNRLYSTRSRVAGRGADQASTGSYLSGLLIGAEVAATPRLLGVEGEAVVLLGSPKLCARYATALARRGIATSLADGDEAVKTGLLCLARMKGLM
ncbi:MAG: 2-dehydro-3-deoxygalactonokinase [Phenylobacterium zucineum]|nr:MAG: 2-dehydro-3-deoxygalactonokinase [Phenylobacterium zucineum]